MKIPMNAISGTIEALLRSDARSATKYLDPVTTVRVSRQIFKHGGERRGADKTLLVTIGRPNYAARQFIRDCKKAGEPFPVRKIQLRFRAKRK